MRKCMLSDCCWSAEIDRQTATDSDGQRQTTIDSDRWRQTETDNDRQRQTVTDRDRQRQTAPRGTGIIVVTCYAQDLVPQNRQRILN